MKCTRIKCFALTPTGLCGILTSHCTRKPCPFFKTADELKEQEKELKKRLKKKV